MPYLRRSRYRYRASLLAAVASLTLLTACQEEVDGDASASPSSSDAAAGAPSAGGEAEGQASPSKTAGDQGSAADDDARRLVEGVSGTFANGMIEYLAPGKYIVSTDDKNQGFFVSDDTDVFGAGVLCGTYSPQASRRCSLAELEEATKGGSVAADVVIKGGVATRITERSAPDEGAPVDE